MSEEVTNQILKYNRYNSILLVGLGNPGDQYQNTRHNIGFTMIDAIAENYDFPQYSTKFSSLISNKIINSTKVILLKPQTYMNLSGEALSKVSHFYKIALDDIIVFYDDLDLDNSRVKIKKNGGSGGHNGIKSIDQYLGKDYHRFRIGIGKPPVKMETSNYVLSKFSLEEQNSLDSLKKNILENFNLVLEKSFPLLMNKISMDKNVK